MGEDLMNVSALEKHYEALTGLALSYLPKVALALVTLIVGLWLIGMAIRVMRKGMEVKDIDPSLRSFACSVSGMTLKALLIISVASMIGIEMTSFIALLGAAGVAVGMALSGTLQNFAGGVLILILRPFKVGDVIEAQGFVGTVKEIQIFFTVLTTPDNKRIIIPNSPLSTGSLINYSAEPKRRVDFVFGIGYDDDFEKAKAIIQELAAADERVHKDPEPFTKVTELADSSVNITARFWCERADYWDIKHDITEAVKKRFDAEGISIPYPQQDVYIHQVAGNS